MSIVRTNIQQFKKFNYRFEQNAVAIPLKIISNKTLADSAKLLLIYLHGIPHTWDIYSHWLCDQLGWGRDKLQKSIRNLLDEGYLKRTQIKDEKNRFSHYCYQFYFEPVFLQDINIKEDAPPEKPNSKKVSATVFSGAGKPVTNIENKNNSMYKESMKDARVPASPISKPKPKKESLASHTKKDKEMEKEPRPKNKKEKLLNKEQHQVYEWLKSLAINTDEETLSWWAKSYSKERLQDVYQYAKEKNKGNLGGYMNKLLKKVSIVENSAVRANRKVAEELIKEHKLKHLTVQSKYVVVDRGRFTEDIPLFLDPPTFYEKLISEVTDYEVDTSNGIDSNGAEE